MKRYNLDSKFTRIHSKIEHEKWWLLINKKAMSIVVMLKVFSFYHNGKHWKLGYMFLRFTYIYVLSNQAEFYLFSEQNFSWGNN